MHKANLKGGVWSNAIVWLAFLSFWPALASPAHLEVHRSVLPSSQRKQEMPARKRTSVTVAHPIVLPVKGIAQQLWASAASDDRERLLVCTMEADPRQARVSSSVYSSLDGGNSWMRTLLDSRSDWVSEANCAAGSKGRAYFVAGVSDTSLGGIDHSSGTTEIYRSADGGLSWSEPRRYPFIDWMQLAVLSIGREDTIYLFGNEQAVGNGETGAGAWEGKRRLMRKSADGLLFSLPVYPEGVDPGNRDQGFPLTGLVMNNGDAVVLFGEIPSQTLAVYAARSTGYRLLSSIGMPPRTKANGVLSAQMAFESSGDHAGRLYVTTPALEDDRPVLVLAYSDDGGSTWLSKVAMHSFPPKSDEINYSYSAVAVNPNGVVGIEWLATGDCPIFAISDDGGASIGWSQQLGSCGRADAARPQLSMEANLNAYNDRSSVQHPLAFSRSALPGLSIRAAANLLGSVRITADLRGRFHAFWSEPQWDGIQTLTATITVGENKPEKIIIREEEELTSQSVVRLEQQSFDPSQGLFNLDLRVRNISSTAIRYPKFLALEEERSDCGEMSYLSQALVSQTGRPVLRLPQPPDRALLFPREDSLPVHLTVSVPACSLGNISMAHAARRKALEHASFFPVVLRFRVYAARHQSQ